MRYLLLAAMGFMIPPHSWVIKPLPQSSRQSCLGGDENKIFLHVNGHGNWSVLNCTSAIIYIDSDNR